MNRLLYSFSSFLPLWIISEGVIQPTTGGAIIQPDLPFPQFQCFFTSWSRYRDAWAYTPANVEPFMCTTIVYAFAQILDDRIALYDWKDEDNLRDLVALKQINPNLRIHLSVGGWTLSYQFRPMAISPDSRQSFISSTVNFLRAYELDGIDVDWEYPEEPDRELYTALITEFRQAFDDDARKSGKRRLALTVDVGALMHGGYDVPKLAPLLDLVNVMAYDYHGSWEQKTGHNAPLYKRSNETDYQAKLNVEYSANLWITAGIAKEKLAIGIPTYGRSWVLQNPKVNDFNSPTKSGGPKGPYSKEIGSLAYFEICDRVINQKTLTPVTNAECQCSYATGGDFWVSYDDAASVTQKARWIKAHGLNGVLVWELGMDDFKGSCGTKKNPLFSAIYEVFYGKPIPTLPPTTLRPGQTTTPRPPIKTDKPIIPTNSKPVSCDDAFCSLRPAGDYSTGPCESAFCTCVGGFSYVRDCPPSTIYDPMNKVCSWPQSVPGCLAQTSSNKAKLVKEELKTCRDEGNCLCDPPFCKRHGLGDFALGLCLTTFCSCAPGDVAYTRNCPEPLIYDPMLSVCNWKGSVTTC